MTPKSRPQSRSEGVIVERLPGETLIYDLERDEAHRLNPTAAAVFDACDGRATVEEIAVRAAEPLRQPVSAQAVADALALLADRQLLVGALGPGLSRREIVRRAALVGAGIAAAAPVVESIVAPTVAHAQSPGACNPSGGNVPNGSFCGGDSTQCCSFCCCVSGPNDSDGVCADPGTCPSGTFCD